MRRARILIGLIAALAAALAASRTARANYLVTDLSERRIEITTGFAGDNVLLFGSTDTGGDIIVVIRGPDQPVVVRRKARVAGIWVNRSWVAFNNVPSFYYVASSRPLNEVTTPEALARIQAGLDHLRFQVATSSTGLPTEEFRQALIRGKQKKRLYYKTPGDISFIAGHLFRTTVHFPANVPTGAYKVEIYLVHKGKIVGSQFWPLIVTKVGISAEIYDSAHQDAALYGIVAVLVATMAGWLGALGFRRA